MLLLQHNAAAALRADAMQCYALNVSIIANVSAIDGPYGQGRRLVALIKQALSAFEDPDPHYETGKVMKHGGG